MPSFIVEAPIDRVLDNPHRDFKNYPIDRAQVERLKASFEDTGGIWHGLPARRAVKDALGWTYELCFGHHRLVAAKELGYEKVKLEVGEHDEDEMILMLATENGTQRVNNAAASLDSVAAITRRLAYVLLRTNDETEVSKIFDTSVSKLFAGRSSYANAKQAILNSKGVGERMIFDYAPNGTLELGEIRSAIATLKQDGGYQRLIETVTAQVQAELAEEEAERQRKAEIERQKAEVEREKAEAQAERDRVKAEKDAERERKREAKAKADAEAAEWRRQEAEAKKQADAQAKAQRDKDAAEREEQEAAAEQARIKQREEQREREAEQRQKDRAAYEAEQNQKRADAEKREAELLALAVKAAEAEPLLDGRVVPYFRNHHALSRFREIVTDGNNRHWFPVAEQLNHVQTICALFEKQNKKPAAENLTANYVANYLNGYLRECTRGKREDEKRQRTLDQSFDLQLEKALKGANWITSAVVDMIGLIEDGASVPEDFEAKLRSLEDRTTNQLVLLRKASGYTKGGKEIAGRAVANRARPAIANQTTTS